MRQKENSESLGGKRSIRQERKATTIYFLTNALITFGINKTQPRATLPTVAIAVPTFLIPFVLQFSHFECLESDDSSHPHLEQYLIATLI